MVWCYWVFFFSFVKCEHVSAETCSDGSYLHCLLPVRWWRARKRRSWHRQRRRVMKVASLMSSNYTQRGPPSPTWAPPAQGGLHPSPPVLLNPYYCSFCSCLPPLAGGRTEDIKKHARTHTHTDAHTCTCTHSHIMDLQYWTDGYTVLGSIVKKWTSHLSVASPWFLTSVLASFLFSTENGTLLNMVWLQLRWCIHVLRAQ